MHGQPHAMPADTHAQTYTNATHCKVDYNNCFLAPDGFTQPPNNPSQNRDKKYSTHPTNPLRGLPLDIGGGGAGVFGRPFFLFHKGDGRRCCFSHLGIGCIPTMPCGHLFISPISWTLIY